MPAGAVLRLTEWWSATSSAGNKTYKTYFGATGSGLGGAPFASVGPLTTSAVITTQRMIANRTTSSQFSTSQITNVNPFSATPVVTTSSVNTTVATEITITGTLGSAGDTLTLEGYLLEMMLP